MGNNENINTRIEIRTGSDSDIPKIKQAYQMLEKLGISYCPRILSAHRIPQIMAGEAQKLYEKGFSVSIAAAGGSAHLPGMTASETLLPVVGLPVKTSVLGGVDSLYSIIQMPNGIPVGTVGIGRAGDAALLAAQIAFLDDPIIRIKIRKLRNLPPVSHPNPPIQPSVLIIKPDAALYDEKYLAEMSGFINEVGLTAKHKTIVNNEMVPGETAFFRHCAIIVIIPLENIALITGIFKLVSNTEIPIITLPVINGKTHLHNPLHFFNQILNHGDEASASPYFPVAGMGLNRYLNAGIFAAQIAGLYFPGVLDKLKKYRKNLSETVIKKDRQLMINGIDDFLSPKKYQ
jgi:5-(carboxyamino)imidazole ribonucleotide mutase